MPGRFAETVGLDDSFDFFSWEESRPWRGLGRASMPGRWRGRASMPGSWGLAAIGKKKRAAVLRTGGLEFFSWEESRPWRGLGRLEASMPGRWRGRVAPGAPSLNMSTRHVEAIRLRCGAGFYATQVARNFEYCGNETQPWINIGNLSL